jgi:hypothetical protein
MRHKLSEFVIDPGSREFSMSRLCLGVLVLMDVAWAIACILGLPPHPLVSPVCSLLGTVTGAVCGVYGVNSFGGAWRKGPQE